MSGNIAGALGGINPDPTKIIKDTGSSITKLGKEVAKQPAKAVQGGMKAVVAAVKFAGHTVDGAVDAAVTGAKNTANMAGKAIGIDEAGQVNTSTPAKPARPQSNTSASSASKPNIAQSLGKAFDFS
jgi:hypothetical protein